MIREGSVLTPVLSKDITLGDLIYLKNGREIPADVVLLASTNIDGHCFIQTAQLVRKKSISSVF